MIWCWELIALERWLPYACSDSLRQVPMCGHAAPSLLQFHGMNEVCVCKIKREPAKIDCLHSSDIALNSFCVHGMYVQVCMHDCVSDTVYDVIPVFWGNAHKYRYHHYVEKLCMSHSWMFSLSRSDPSQFPLNTFHWAGVCLMSRWDLASAHSRSPTPLFNTGITKTRNME